MKKEEINMIIKIFKAIEDDWAICDDSDKDEHMVLVNEDREIKDDLKPPKNMIYNLEEEGLIELNKELSDKKGSVREYMESLKGGEIPIPFVFFYKITDKGKSFRDKNHQP